MEPLVLRLSHLLAPAARREPPALRVTPTAAGLYEVLLVVAGH